ncbi:MAG: epoxyqueuosine reductase [Candidatus Xenobiia bacterium LiM19]
MGCREKIKEAGLSLGLHEVRFTTAEPLPDTAGAIRERIRRGFIPVEKVRLDADIDRWCSPLSFLEEARSVIVAALCYNTEEESGASSPDGPCGAVAPYTRRNYYRIMIKTLKALACQIRSITGHGRFYISSNSVLREKPLAERSGLGCYGKHGIIISPGWGSKIVLGTIVTDLELPPDEPGESLCGNCNLCMKLCPVGAIVEPGVTDERICLQSLSQSVSMAEEFREIWGTRLYGCSECHSNCPRNSAVPLVKPISDAGRVCAEVPLMPILSKSDEELRELFRGNQMSARWLPPDALRKNACIALGNHGDPVALPLLYQTLISGADSLGEYAAWALWRIGGISSRTILEKALKNVVHEENRACIARYLER